MRQSLLPEWELIRRRTAVEAWVDGKRRDERCRNQKLRGKGRLYVGVPSPSHCNFVSLLQHPGPASQSLSVDELNEQPVNIREYYEKDEHLLLGKMEYLSQDITSMVEANVVNAFWEISDKQSLLVDGFGGQNGEYPRILRKRWTYAT